MHWITAIEFARNQHDVTYEEWCNLYYDHRDPTPEQVEKACETAQPILVRNNVIHESVTEFKGVKNLQAYRIALGRE